METSINNKCKAFTSLNQSKKLAGILPLEGADMHYATWTILGGEFIVSPNQGDTIESLQEDYGNQIIPCWSLTALLDILPNYQMQTQDDGIGILCSCNGKFNIVTADNPIDACVAMIEELHELKML